MPGCYWIDTTRHVVFARAWGVLVDTELVAHVKALRDDTRFALDFGQIADFREVTDYGLTAEGVRSHVHRSPFSPEVRRAIVVAPGVGVGFARMYQASLAGGLESFQVFHTLEDANEWVGLDRDAPWPEGPPDVVIDAAQARSQ